MLSSTWQVHLSINVGHRNINRSFSTVVLCNQSYYPRFERSQNETETDDFGFCCRLLSFGSGGGRIYPYPWRRFSVDLCYAWEKEATHCPEPTRLVITRFGVVLSPDGGAMQQMLRPLQATKIATAIGPGTQVFPWISIRDLAVQWSSLSLTKRHMGYITWLLRSRSRNMLSPVRWERLIGHGQRW